MALTNVEALDVVIGCVKKAGGRDIGPTDSLSSGGIVDAPRLTSLKTLIVANKTLGVAKFDHTLDPAVLGNMSTGDSAQDAADVVRDNAVAVAAAAMAAPMGFAAGSSRAAAPRAAAPPKPKPAAPPKPKPAARATQKRKVKKAGSPKRGRKPAKRTTTRRRKSSRRRQK